MSELTDREKVILLAEGVMGWATKDGHTGPGTEGMVKILAEIDGSSCQLIWWPGCYAERWRTWNPLESISDAMEMQAKIPVEMRADYVRALLDAVPQAQDNCKETALWLFASATAAQRCGAAIAVLEEQ